MRSKSILAHRLARNRHRRQLQGPRAGEAHVVESAHRHPVGYPDVMLPAVVQDPQCDKVVTARDGVDVWMPAQQLGGALHPGFTSQWSVTTFVVDYVPTVSV